MALDDEYQENDDLEHIIGKESDFAATGRGDYLESPYFCHSADYIGDLANASRGPKANQPITTINQSISNSTFTRRI